MTDLLDLVNARWGHFAYESGLHGELWLDLDRLFADPARLDPMFQRLGSALSRYDADAICGPMSGGAFIAFRLAAMLGVRFAWTERRVERDRVWYQLPAPIAELVSGQRIIIVDDVINAGSATKATIDAVLAAGGRPVAIGALLTLGEGATRLAQAHALPLERLGSEPLTLWAPVNCPMCAAGRPLDSTGPV